MLGSAGSARAQRQKKERKITAIFRPMSKNQHAAALTSLAIDGSQDRVYTASRDFTAKRWDFRDYDRPEVEATFDGHTDWVNDVVLMGSTTVATASADHGIRLWDSCGVPKYQFIEHKDDVTCLAAAPAHSLLASGGLSSQAFLWDVVAGKKLRQEYEPREAPGLKHSVYSIALSANGSLLATGSPEACIRLTDPRSNAKLFKLRGHTGNVRALQLNAGGTMCVSASSDHTLRLWDLGQQRCVGVYAVHDDAAWTVAINASFSRATSGGRDGCVYTTELATRESALLCKGLGPVRRLAHSADGTCVWTASEGIGLAAWPAAPLPLVLPLMRSRRASLLATRQSTAGAALCSDAQSLLQEAPSHSHDATLPTSTADSSAASPVSAATRHSVLISCLPPPGGARPVTSAARATSADSRMKIQASATTDSASSKAGPASTLSVYPRPVAFVAPLSPAQRTRQVAEDGDSSAAPLLAKPLVAVAMQTQLVEATTLNDQRSVLTRDRSGAAAVWDVTTGSITEQRPRTHSFADDVALAFLPLVVSQWFTVKIVSGLLAVTVDPVAASMSSAEAYETDLGFDAKPEERIFYAEHFVKGLFCLWASLAQLTTDNSLPRIDNTRRLDGSRTPFVFWEGPEPPPLLVFQSADGRQNRKLVTSRGGIGFTGDEEPGQCIPDWVVRCLISSKLPEPPHQQFPFQLVPTKGSRLPELKDSSLTAPAIMKLDKVVSHVHSSLASLGVDVSEPALRCIGDQQPLSVLPAGAPPTLELTCRGWGLPLNLTLAAAAKYIWKTKGNLQIDYGILDPACPAPMANIQPS